MRTAARHVGTAAGDYPQNWYDQGIAVDPNNPDRVFVDTFDVWLATRTGTTWYDMTCGYSGRQPEAGARRPARARVRARVVQHPAARATTAACTARANADAATLNTLDPTWFNMDTGLNTIEFYSGDISGNFATAASPSGDGGAQDNGPSVGHASPAAPTGPVQWQMGRGGDGFYARIDPVGTGTSLRFWQWQQQRRPLAAASTQLH